MYPIFHSFSLRHQGGFFLSYRHEILIFQLEEKKIFRFDHIGIVFSFQVGKLKFHASIK